MKFSPKFPNLQYFHAVITNWIRSLYFDLCFHLPEYFVYANSEGSVECAFVQVYPNHHCYWHLLTVFIS